MFLGTSSSEHQLKTTFKTNLVVKSACVTEPSSRQSPTQSFSQMLFALRLGQLCESQKRLYKPVLTTKIYLPDQGCQGFYLTNADNPKIIVKKPDYILY